MSGNQTSVSSNWESSVRESNVKKTKIEKSQNKNKEITHRLSTPKKKKKTQSFFIFVYFFFLFVDFASALFAPEGFVIVFLPFFDIKHALFRAFVHVRTMYMRAYVTSIAARMKECQVRQEDGKPSDTEYQPMSQNTA